MLIPRTLAVLLALIATVAAWLLVSMPDMTTVQVLSGDMAPAKLSASGPLPADPPADLDWRPIDQRVLSTWREPYWLRWRSTATTPSATASSASPALRLSLRGASRLYWNGQALPGNGVVGRTPAEERPGLVDVVRLLPPAPATGTNELLVLASSHHQSVPLRSADALAVLAPPELLYGHVLRPWLIAAFASGALAAAGLYFLAVQRGRWRQPNARLLIALCLVGLTLPVIEGWRSLLGYAYPWHSPRLLALLALHVAAAVLLPAYLARRFGVALPKGGCVAYLAMLAGAAAFMPSFDYRSVAVLLLSLLLSAGLLLRAQGARDERWPILALLLVSALALAVARGAFLNGPFFLFLSVLMGFLLLRHAAQLRALDAHNARLREERAQLSLQLLQRGIQPHWLMNTLTCLQELIEQAPARASRMVESLAEQFDRLRDSSSRQSVPLADELALCRNHLEIVGLASDQRMSLEVEAEVEANKLGLSLPPGILHAQVENALTHAGATACAQRPFRLRVSRESERWILELRSASGSSAHRGRGTGTRYIEASLAAACPGGWHFAQGPDGADWHGRIEMTCAS